MVDHEEMRLRHLTDIQLIIARLSENSFVIRGWSVTLVSVIVAFIDSRNDSSRLSVLVAVPPTVVFWWLDAYYLRQERLFRLLYRATARRLVDGDVAPNVQLFDMDIAQYSSQAPRLYTTLLSPRVLAIPAMLLMVVMGSLVL